MDEETTPTRTLYQRRSRSLDRTPEVEHFELFPGSQSYATPWDANTPQEPWFETTGGPLTPAKDYVNGTEVEYGPLLDNGSQSRLYPFDSNKKVRFASRESNLSGATFTEHAFDEFGSVPSSAGSQTVFFQKPTRRSVLRRNPGNNSIWIPAAHPLWPNKFEPIRWPPLIAHGVVAVLAYPILIVTASIAQGRSLFWARFIVGAAAGMTGFLLGLTLMEVGKRLLEACTWATIVHHSMFEGRSGITLKDLESKSTYPNFTWLGANLLWERAFNRGTRRSHRAYDKTLWSAYIIFFIIISIMSACLSFLLGRLVDIKTRSVWQDKSYKEVQIMGDLSADDIVRAQVGLGAIGNFLQTWTMSPYGAGTQTAQAVTLKWQGQNVYFAEISTTLLNGGKGYGTFAIDNVADDRDESNLVYDDLVAKPVQDGTVPLGSVLRFSRWGLRIKCEKIPEPTVNIVPKAPSNYTYTYVPNSVISNTLSSLGRDDLSFEWVKSGFLREDDQIPEGVNMDDIGYVARFWDNGVAHSFSSRPVSQGEDGLGWVELDLVVLRINTTYTPVGSFGAHLDFPELGGTSIGYDAALCMQAVEPWVIDAYNSTNGVSTTFKIIGKGDMPNVAHDYGRQEGRKLDLQSSLSSVGKFDAYAAAHGNSRNILLKDNGRDFWWVPSPTVISWTGKSSPDGFESLSTEYLEAGLGTADAAQQLPFLTGSQPILAYQYPDKTLAEVTVFHLLTIITLVIILLLGFVGAFLVPRLPLGIPRRDFGVFTWLAAFEGDDVIHPAVKKGIDRNMDLEELERRFGKQKIRLGI